MRGLFWWLGGIGWALLFSFSPASSAADQRIDYYRARIGGPSTYPAYARLGLAYAEKARETGQAKWYVDATRYLQQSLKHQRNFEALYGLGLVLSEQHQFREGLTFAQEAAASSPSSLEAQGVLFDIQLALGNVPQAETIVNGMIGAQRDFQSLTRLAALREYRGEYKGAIEALKEAHDPAASEKISPAVRAWLEVRLGSLLLAECRINEARDAYQRALQIVPDYFFAREHLAEWHAAQRQWSVAVDLYRALLKTRPEPQYRLALAEILALQGDRKNARREQEAALKQLRQSVREGAQDVFRPLALLLLENRKTRAEGLSFAERDWKIRQDAWAADMLAWAYWQNDRVHEARKLSEQALRSGNKSPVLLLHGATILLRSGERARVSSLLEQATACGSALSPGERALAETVREELASAGTKP